MEIDKQLNQYFIELNDDTIDKSSLAITKQNIFNKFSNYKLGNEYINSIAVVTNNNRYCVNSRKKSNNNSVWDNPEDRKILLDNLSGKFKLNYLPISQYSGFLDGNYLGIASRIGPITKDKTYGGIFITLDESFLHENNLNNEELKSIKTLIVSNDDNIILFEDSDYMNTNFQEYKNTVLKNMDYSIITISIKGTDWDIVSIIDNQMVKKEASKSSVIILFIALIISIIIITSLCRISSNYTKSIAEISRGISKYSLLDGNSEINIDHKDELYSIAYQFNKMAIKNKNLINLVQKKNNEIIEATNNQRKAEIKALRAQINPHFLYNTLDSINWMAIENDQIKISEMLSSLGEILRYNISNIDELVKVGDEVEWLKKYFFLQQERFNHAFEYYIRIDEECNNFLIHKLLLQPIIENAIIHGMEGIKENGIIKVVIEKDKTEKNIFDISIYNNGVAIEERELNNIRKLIDSKEQTKGSGIGLNNVINRLKLYDDKVRLCVDSTLKWTIFTLKFPIRLWPSTSKKKFSMDEKERSEEG
jgi:two-component system sensor histidine kinase YesM